MQGNFDSDLMAPGQVYSRCPSRSPPGETEAERGCPAGSISGFEGMNPGLYSAVSLQQVTVVLLVNSAQPGRFPTAGLLTLATVPSPQVVSEGNAAQQFDVHVFTEIVLYF